MPLYSSIRQNDPLSTKGYIPPSQRGLYEHQVETELTVSNPPRNASYTKGTVYSRYLLANLIVGALCAFVFLGGRDIGDLKALATRGQDVGAVVDDKWIEDGSRYDTYCIRYRFEASGESIEETKKVSADLYNQIQLGETVPVTVLPENPHVRRFGLVDNNQIGDQQSKWFGGGFLVVGLLVSLFAVVELDFRKQMRLLQYGIPVTGRVTDSRVVAGKTTSYYVTYAFELTKATQFRKQVSVSKGTYERYTVGDPQLTVLYDPENPDQNLPYEFIGAAKLNAAS